MRDSSLNTELRYEEGSKHDELNSVGVVLGGGMVFWVFFSFDGRTTEVVYLIGMVGNLWVNQSSWNTICYR